MAKHTNKAQGSAYEAKLIRHMLKVFAAYVPGRESLDANDICVMLGVEEGEALQMMRLGAFGPPSKRLHADTIETKALARFLELHGRRWVLTRLTKTIAALNR